MNHLQNVERSKPTCVRAAPGRQVQLSRVRVEHVDVLVEEELHELGRLQELPLAAEDAGSLLRGVHHAAARQREDHHEGVLQVDGQTETWEKKTHRRTGRPSHGHAKAVNTHVRNHKIG